MSAGAIRRSDAGELNLYVLERAAASQGLKPEFKVREPPHSTLLVYFCSGPSLLSMESVLLRT